MIKTYSYEKGVEQQVVKLRYPGAPGLESIKFVDTEAFYHIEPEKMKNELRFIIMPYEDDTPELFSILYRYDSPEELFISQHGPEQDRISRDAAVAGRHFYYNGERVYAIDFTDVMNFVYRHIADKLMDNAYSHSLKESLQESKQNCQRQETESEQEQERE